MESENNNGILTSEIHQNKEEINFTKDNNYNDDNNVKFLKNAESDNESEKNENFDQKLSTIELEEQKEKEIKIKMGLNTVKGYILFKKNLKLKSKARMSLKKDDSSILNFLNFNNEDLNKAAMKYKEIELKEINNSNNSNYLAMRLVYEIKDLIDDKRLMVNKKKLLEDELNKLREKFGIQENEKIEKRRRKDSFNSDKQVKTNENHLTNISNAEENNINITNENSKLKTNKPDNNQNKSYKKSTNKLKFYSKKSHKKEASSNNIKVINEKLNESSISSSEYSDNSLMENKCKYNIKTSNLNLYELGGEDILQNIKRHNFHKKMKNNSSHDDKKSKFLINLHRMDEKTSKDLILKNEIKMSNYNVEDNIHNKNIDNNQTNVFNIEKKDSNNKISRLKSHMMVKFKSNDLNDLNALKAKTNMFFHKEYKDLSNSKRENIQDENNLKVNKKETTYFDDAGNDIDNDNEEKRVVDNVIQNPSKKSVVSPLKKSSIHKALVKKIIDKVEVNEIKEIAKKKNITSVNLDQINCLQDLEKDTSVNKIKSFKHFDFKSKLSRINLISSNIVKQLNITNIIKTGGDIKTDDVKIPMNYIEPIDGENESNENELNSKSTNTIVVDKKEDEMSYEDAMSEIRSIKKMIYKIEKFHEKNQEKLSRKIASSLLAINTFNEIFTNTFNLKINFLYDLCKNFKLKKLKKGEFLFRDGDKAENIYIIIKGELSPTNFKGKSSFLSNVIANYKMRNFNGTNYNPLYKIGSIIGHQPFIFGTKYLSNVIAQSNCLLASVDIRKMFTMIVRIYY